MALITHFSDYRLLRVLVSAEYWLQNNSRLTHLSLKRPDLNSIQYNSEEVYTIITYTVPSLQTSTPKQDTYIYIHEATTFVHHAIDVYSVLSFRLNQVFLTTC